MISRLRHSLQYFQNAYRELQYVHFPKRQEVISTSIMVFVFVLIAAIFFFFVDHVISFFIKLLLNV